MKIEYLERKSRECKAKLSDNLSGLEYDKVKSDKLLEEDIFLEKWIRELKGLTL